MSDKLDADQITTVINALVGDTTPVGEEQIDKIKRENQKVLFEVTENLIWQICKNLKYMNRKEDSMFRIGYDAEKFLSYLVKEYELNNYVEEKEE